MRPKQSHSSECPLSTQELLQLTACTTVESW